MRVCVCRFDFIELYIHMINMRIWFGLIINKCIWVHFIWPVDVSQRNLADLAMGISTNKNSLGITMVAFKRWGTHLIIAGWYAGDMI